MVGGAGAWLLGRSMRGCDPVERSRLAAPDSTHEAILWGYDCGWMMKGVTGVTVVETGDSLAGNVSAYSAMDTTATRLVTNRQQPHDVELHWQASDTLLIRYDPRASDMGRRTTVRGVTIRYEPLP